MSSTYCAVVIPGPKGEPGTGTAGTDGIDAFTVTTANFTVPAVLASVVVSVENGLWATVGQTLFVLGAGYFEVVARGATSLTLKNLFNAADGNAAPGTVMANGAQVSPAGRAGVNSLVTSSTTAFPSMAAFYAADVTMIANFGVIELTGYFAAGDMGGGLFRYDQTDVASADDGGRIIVNGTRRFKRVVAFNDPIRAEFFGAVPTTSTLVQAALNTIAIRKCVAYYNRVDFLGSASYPDASATPTPLTYYIDNDIRVTNGTQIRGAGKGRTVLKVVNLSTACLARIAAAPPPPKGYYYSIIETNVDPVTAPVTALVGPVYGLPYGKADNVVVEDLTLDCNANGQGAVRITMQGVDIYGCNLNCFRVKVTGFASSTPGSYSSECFPVSAQFHTDTTDVTGHKVIDCEFTGAATGGIHAGGYEITCINLGGRSGKLAEGIVVEGNLIHDIRGVPNATYSLTQYSILHAIAVGNCNGAIVTGNAVVNFDGAGFYVDTGEMRQVEICNNLFEEVYVGVEIHSLNGSLVSADDILIHHNSVKTISGTPALDPGTNPTGFRIFADVSATANSFRRIEIRDNHVYGREVVMPLTNLTHPIEIFSEGWPVSIAGTSHTSTLVDGLVFTTADPGFDSANLLYLFVSGSGIPAGTYVVGTPSATSITLSAATSSSLVGTTLTFSQKYYPSGFQLINVPTAICYDKLFVHDNTFETPDVGVIPQYWFSSNPYSLGGYILYTYSYDATKFKWGLNKNLAGKEVQATVIYSGFSPAYRLFGGSQREETFAPNEWPDDIDMSWYDSSTRNRFSARQLPREIASGLIVNRLAYQVVINNVHTDILTYNTRVVTGDTTNTSQIITNIADTTLLGLNYRVSGAGIDSRAYITEIQGPTTVKISHAATATAAGVSLTFKLRAASAGLRGGTVNYTAPNTTAVCTNTALLERGDIIGSPNVPLGTYIVSITNGTDFVMSAGASITAADISTFTPATGTPGNGGVFDGISGVAAYTATGTTKVFEAVPYSWQINGERIWQSMVAGTYITEAILSADRMVNGHISVLFGTVDTEKIIYIPPAATFKGREFYILAQKGATTTPRGIHLRCGTPGGYTAVILAPGLEYDGDPSGFVSTCLLSRPSSDLTLTGISLRAMVDGSGWLAQARVYESGSKQSVNVVKVTAAVSSYSLSTVEFSRELDGIVQVAFDGANSDKTVVLPNPTAYKGRKFELVVYKALTPSACRVKLNFSSFLAIVDPNTNQAVTNLFVSTAATAITATRILLTCDGLNWFPDFQLTKALVESSLLAGATTMALTNAFTNVVYNAVTQQIVLPYPGTYLVTASAGFADIANAAPKRIFLEVYNTTAAAQILKSLQSCLFADITPNTTTQVRAEALTTTFFLTVAAATTLTLRVKQDTTATAAVYEDFTYFGAALIHV